MLTNRIDQLEQFLKEDPQDAFTLYALALEYIKLEDFNKAEILFLAITDKHPDYLAVYYHFGKLYEKLNQQEKANSIYIKGMELAERKKDLKTLNEIREAYNSLNGIEED